MMEVAKIVLHVRTGKRGGRDLRYRISLGAARQNNGETLCGAEPSTSDVSRPAGEGFLSWPASVRQRSRWDLCQECVAVLQRTAAPK